MTCRYLFLGIDERIAQRIEPVLAVSGWRPASKADVNAGFVDLILCAAADAGAPSERSFGSAPRLALFSGGSTLAQADDIISADSTDGEILAQIERWRPTSDTQRFADVARAFGDGIIPIARGLRDQLHQAIAALDAGSFTAAHRIAGLAGTLGFKRTSQAWLKIDEGDLSDLPTARREARLAVAAIERWLAATESGRDSAA